MKKNISNMMGLDIYLSSLTNYEYKKIAPQIESKSFQTMPLVSWDIFSESRFNAIKQLNRNQDISKVIALAEKLNWKNDINAIFEGNSFEAILVTDLEQKIIWVNDGFTNMTGYTKMDALNKTPSFLQGNRTTVENKVSFRKKLNGMEPFTEIITNYKKSSEIYECEVKIFPLYTKEKTHFIALERQVG